LRDRLTEICGFLFGFDILKNMKFNPAPSPEPHKDVKRQEIERKISGLQSAVPSVNASRYDVATSILVRGGFMELANKIYRPCLENIIRYLSKFPGLVDISHLPKNIVDQYARMKSEGYLFNQETESVGQDLARLFAIFHEECADKSKDDICYGNASDLYRIIGMEEKSREMLAKAEPLEIYYASNPRTGVVGGVEDLPKFSAELLQLVEKYKDLPPVSNEEKAAFNESVVKQIEEKIGELKSSLDRPV